MHSAHDALAVCLHETGVVEIPRIAELLGRSEDEVIAELGSAIYLDAGRSQPGRDVWVPADEALSGAVRTKLAEARKAAETDPRFARTVAALEEAQPEDLRPSDITARLGAPWIPTADIEGFIAEVIGVEAGVWHTKEVASWTLDKDRSGARRKRRPSGAPNAVPQGTDRGCAQSGHSADLGHLARRERRAPAAECPGDRGRQGKARRHQDVLPGLGVAGSRARRASGAAV